jgi:UDP-N-acetylmuramate dehydrogenase
MTYQTQVSLRAFNSFGIEATVERYAPVHSVPELQHLLEEPDDTPLRMLGGGSNVLITRDLPGRLLHVRIPGRQIETRAGDAAIVSAGAGENWHEFVLWSLAQGLGGLENLSLIPGSVGAAPIQNIGAYGVELADVFDHLEAVDLHTGATLRMDGAECSFGYRDSFFKKEGLGRYCITKVFFRLSAAHHRLHLEYGAIRETLAEMGIAEPGIHDISRAVIHIRSSKLPDPALIGNAGSFFKNPEIDSADLERLQQLLPDLAAYPAGEGRHKIPAARLIEACGWKGYRQGDAGCYEKQALVLVNYGHAAGAEILDLARRVAESVWERYGVRIVPEVNVW